MSDRTMPLVSVTVDTKRLRELAGEATPGPWVQEEHGNAIVIDGTEGYSAGCSAHAVAKRQVAEHTAPE